MRRPFKSWIIVEQTDGYEKYCLVLSATESAAPIDMVLSARERAIIDDACELGQMQNPTLEEARSELQSHYRACVAVGGDGHTYFVLDFQLQKRSLYNYF